MPTLRNHQSFELVKLLGVGDPSTGKTGSLAELINQLPRWGIERVIIQDWDDGLDILSSYVKPEKMDIVFYETLRDKMRATQVGVETRDADAFKKGMALMNNWKTKDVDLGPASGWGPETLFVCDTITGLGDACMGFAVQDMGLDDDWRATGGGMKKQDKYIQLLVTLKCHVIAFSHIRFMGGGGKKAIVDKHGQIEYKEVDSAIDGKAYPSALGRVLPPQVARHFNTVLEWKIEGKNRKIRTIPEDQFALKLPFKLKDNLPQETGLIEIFEAFLSRN